MIPVVRVLLATGVALLLCGGSAFAQLPVPPGGGGGGGDDQEEDRQPPPPPVVEPERAGGWVGYGGDPARRFASDDPSLAPPFGVLWTAQFDSGVRSPLVVGGRVFVAAGAGVHAFDAATGARQWSWSGPAYRLAFGEGGLFLLGGAGLVALDPATGNQLWQYRGTELNVTHSSPVAAGGMVYVQGRGIVALDDSTGRVRWQTGGDGTFGHPAVAGNRLYAQGGCTLSAYDRRDGRHIWSHDDDCSGGGGGLITLARDRVLPVDRAWMGPRRAEDGAPAGGPMAQIVSGDVGVWAVSGSSPPEAVAHDLTDGRELWRAPAGEPAIGLPGHVLGIERSPSLMPAVVVRDLRTGAERWSARLLGDGGPGDDEYATLAAGHGVVAIPHGQRLVVLAPAARAGRAPVTIRLRGRAEQTAGETVTVTGTTGAVLAARRTRLEADEWPFGDAFAPRREGETLADGGYRHPVRLARNVRLRVVADDGRTSDTVIVYAYPRLPLRIRQRAGLVRTRVRFLAPRGVRARGRRVALYLGRRGSRSLRRLDAARLGGRRRRGQATFVFRPLARTRANRRAYLIPCLRRAYRIGLGRADVLSRRCGRRVIRF